MNCINFDIDHLKPIVSFDISKDKELREPFNWKNCLPMLKILQKYRKFDLSDYRL